MKPLLLIHRSKWHRRGILFGAVVFIVVAFVAAGVEPRRRLRRQ
jgi:hypothetical protein